MICAPYPNIEFRNRLIDALQEINLSEDGDFVFKDIVWEEHKPIVILKGHGKIPNFRAVFKLGGGAVPYVQIISDINPYLTKNMGICIGDVDLLASDILLGCCLVMLGLGINPLNWKAMPLGTGSSLFGPQGTWSML